MPTHASFRNLANFRRYRRGFLSISQVQAGHIDTTKTRVFAHRTKTGANNHPAVTGSSPHHIKTNVTGAVKPHSTNTTGSNQPVNNTTGPVTPVLPPSASLVNRCPKPYDQATTSACTANAIMANYDVFTNNLNKPLSRMYLYDGERELEYGLSVNSILSDPNTPNINLSDSGANPVDGMTWFQQVGVVPEEAWPFDVGKVNVVPPASLKSLASQYKIKQSRSVAPNDLHSLKVMLARGFAMAMAISVYNSFMSPQVAQTGTVPMPNPQSYFNPGDWRDPYVGGHEILCVGYDDATQLVTCLNSWGPSWGNHGFFTLPYAYFTVPNLVMGIVGIVEV